MNLRHNNPAGRGRVRPRRLPEATTSGGQHPSEAPVSRWGRGKPQRVNPALTTQRKRAAAITLATALALSGCGQGDGGDGHENSDTTSEGSVATTSESIASPSTRPPQVGAGAGLADTDYVELDQRALNIGTVQTRQPVDGENPADVLVRGLTAGLNWRPASDSTQFDGFVRASSAFNNTYLRDQETRLATLVPMSMADWTTWGDAQQVFFPQVRITNEDHPVDTDTDFSRVVVIDMHTGLQSAPEVGREVFTIIAQARVHRSELGWRIDSFDVRQTIVGDTPGTNASAGSADSAGTGESTGAGEQS